MAIHDDGVATAVCDSPSPIIRQLAILFHCLSILMDSWLKSTMLLHFNNPHRVDPEYGNQVLDLREITKEGREFVLLLDSSNSCRFWWLNVAESLIEG
jgi:hypothetical protein